MSTGKTLIALSLVNSPENCSEEVDKLTYEISSIMREWNKGEGETYGKVHKVNTLRESYSSVLPSGE